jgi:hypothetical protein
MGLIHVPFDRIGSSQRVNLKVDQYADTIYGIKLVGSGDTIFDVSGYGFSGSIKKYAGYASSTAEDIVTVGFDTSNSSAGIVTVLINSGITTNLDKNSPRYTYEVVATEGASGYKRRIMDGNIDINVGISQAETGPEMKCIAVIDEASNFSTATFYDKWASFKTNWPNRLHYLLQPTTSGIVSSSIDTILNIPSNYDSGFGTSPQVKGVARDNGISTTSSDWFGLVGLVTGTDTEVALFLDQSGSMTQATVQASLTRFIASCTDAGISIRTETNAAEDWVEPFTGIL